MKRHRTAFPADVNFSGWWATGPRGTTSGQLTKLRVDPSGRVQYRLLFDNGQVGTRVWTIDDLAAVGATIRRERNEKPSTD